MQFQSLYYQAKPDLRWASLLRRVSKIQVSGTRGKILQSEVPKEQGFYRSFWPWQTLNDLVKEATLQPLCKGQGSQCRTAVSGLTPTKEQHSYGGVQPCYLGKQSILPGQCKQDNCYFFQHRARLMSSFTRWPLYHAHCLSISNKRLTL